MSFHVLEVLLFSAVLTGGQPMVCERTADDTFSCDGAVVGTVTGNRLTLSGLDQVAVGAPARVVIEKPGDGGLVFSNGLTVAPTATGWMQFSNGVSVRRDTANLDGVLFQVGSNVFCSASSDSEATCRRAP